MLARRRIPLPRPLALAVSGDHDTVIAYTGASGGTVSSITVTLTVSGGSGSYSFAWPASLGSTITSSPSSAATHWTYTGHGLASWEIQSFTCTVTDLVTGKVAYFTVTTDMQAGGDPH